CVCKADGGVRRHAAGDHEALARHGGGGPRGGAAGGARKRLAARAETARRSPPAPGRDFGAMGRCLAAVDEAPGSVTHTIRAATLDDLPTLTDIYNYYVVNTTITFDLRPVTVEQRRLWFDDPNASGRHPLLVPVDDERRCLTSARPTR